MPLRIEEAAEAVLITPADLAERSHPDVQLSSVEENPAPPWWDGSGIEIARATRSWIQYGTVAFAVLCIVIGAVEGLFGR